MTKEKIISVGSFVKILDLKHPKYNWVNIYGKVLGIEGETVRLGISTHLNLGTFIERDASSLELSDISSIPLDQVTGLGYSLKSVLPEFY